MRAQAVVATRPTEVAIWDVDVGDPGDWDLLIELECCGLSVGTDLFAIREMRGRHPALLGYAPVGRVIFAGREASRTWHVGDRITYFSPQRPQTPGLHCVPGAYHSPAIVHVAPTLDHALGPSRYVIKVPPDLDSESAAFAGVSAVGSLAAEMAAATVGSKVLILGQGLIGLHTTQHSALRGADVVVSEPRALRRACAQRCGARHVIDPSSEDVAETVRSIWPNGADIVVDTTASYAAVLQSLSALNAGGKFVFLGLYRGTGFNIGTLQGSVSEALFPWHVHGRLVLAAMDLMRRGALVSAALITHRFAGCEAPAAYQFAMTRPGEHLGILLDWRSSFTHR